MQIGLLNDSVLELKGLCLNMMQNSKNCPFCNTNDHHHLPLQQSETLNLKLKQKETEMKKKEEEIVSLQSQVGILNF